MSRIVRVETVTSEEFKNSKVFQSIVKLYRECEDGIVASGDDLKYIYLDLDGNMVEHKFRKVTCNGEEVKDGFSSSTSLLGVKIVYDDGRWEYGFKWWDEKEFITKRKLMSIYMTDGVLNGVSHLIEEFHDERGNKFVPEWVVRKIPFYNERIDDAVGAMDRTIETYDMSLEDWETVCDAGKYSNRCIVTTMLPYTAVNIDGVDCKAPTDIKFMRNPSYWSSNEQGNFCSGIIESQFGGLERFIETGCTAIGINSYLKSVYRDNTKTRKVYRLIPMSSLLSIVRESYDYNRNENKEDDELWNNLDQTVAGNV